MNKIFFCIAAFISHAAWAQDPPFRQRYSSSLQTNPAFAGAFAYPSISVLFRNHTSSHSNEAIHYMFSYNHYVNKLKSGFGFYYVNETDDIYKTQSYHFDYSPSISLDSNWVLKPALEAAYYNKNKTLFYYSGYWGMGYDTSITKEYVDFSTGILLYRKYFDFGFAVHHLLEPDERFEVYNESPLPTRYVAHSSISIPLNKKENIQLTPGLLFLMQQDDRRLELNLAFKVSSVVLGLCYGNQDDFLIAAAYDDGKFRFSYSYDITVSKLRNAAVGAHEMFVSYFIPVEKLKGKKPSLHRVAF